MRGTSSQGASAVHCKLVTFLGHSYSCMSFNSNTADLKWRTGAVNPAGGAAEAGTLGDGDGGASHTGGRKVPEVGFSLRLASYVRNARYKEIT